MASSVRVQCAGASLLTGSSTRSCRGFHGAASASIRAARAGRKNIGTVNSSRSVGTTQNIDWPFPFPSGSVPEDLGIKSANTKAERGSPAAKPTPAKSTSRATQQVFENFYALFAKRPSRPFPPPYTPPNSFSDPLSRHPTLRGYSNGDDALLLGQKFIAVADGVGAWNTRVNGHAALWARLMIHFWSKEMDLDSSNPVSALQRAFETVQVATKPKDEGDGVRHEWQGTTTFCGAVMLPNPEKTETGKVGFLNIGDSQGFLIRPSTGSIEFKTEEQWHWFDCPRQLGTNSPDTPNDNAVYTVKEVQKGDIILLATDGLMDNLWEDEILDIVMTGEKEKRGGDWTAQQLKERAAERGRDPFAESPYMERAIDGGLSVEGGKYDDISVLLSRVSTTSA